MNRLVLFVLLLLFWILLTWTDGPRGYASLQDVVAGVALAWVATWALGERRPERKLVDWLEPRRYAWAVVYAFVLAAYCVKANLEVAYRVLHPAMPIRPGIIRVKTRLQRPAARTILANSVTLCPGTLTVDIWRDGTMMVHWICVESVDGKQAARQILGRFEWFIARIFE